MGWQYRDLHFMDEMLEYTICKVRLNTINSEGAVDGKIVNPILGSPTLDFQLSTFN